MLVGDFGNHWLETLEIIGWRPWKSLVGDHGIIGWNLETMESLVGTWRP